MSDKLGFEAWLPGKDAPPPLGIDRTTKPYRLAPRCLHGDGRGRCRKNAPDGPYCAKHAHLQLAKEKVTP